MNCEQCRGAMPQLWEGALDSDARAPLELHLAGCLQCRTEAENLGSIWQGLGRIPDEDPGPALRTRFYEKLEAYQQGYVEAKPLRRPWNPRFAIPSGLAAMLALGFFGGFALNRGRDDSQLTQLRNEVTNMRQMVALSLLQQQNASDRLKGVNWAYRVEQPDTEVLAALLYTVNHDPNVNVRLAAVDAVRTFADSPVARRGLVQAIPKQNSPIVQIALIDQLADVHDRSAAPVLQSLAQDGSVNGEVRQRAQWALGRLQ